MASQRIFPHNTQVHLRKTIIGIAATTLLFVCLPAVSAAAAPLTYRYKHHIFTIQPQEMRDWKVRREFWTYRGTEVAPPQELRVDADIIPPLPSGFAREERETWDRAAIGRTIERRVAAVIDREPGSVVISRSATGAIVFDGTGFPGQTTDIPLAAALTLQALEAQIADIELPVIETQPRVTVADGELRNLGIRELVTIGESDYSGSTQNRIHNIRVGLNRFNGHLIKQGDTFSFVGVLGRVDATTGYRKELTILGNKTLPDYGGGLCQVSSTAYRGVWEYGFPILQRKNHSFAVHYYAPQGTDATVYPPYVDMKFKNDSPGALLIQTAIDPSTTRAFFLYYGTRDDRTAGVFGPYTWDHKAAPPSKTEYTLEIPAGTKRKVGEAVPGMQTAWFRILKSGGVETEESVYSTYEARPLFWQIGVDTLPSGSGSLTEAPETEAVISD